jgi:metallophosphoesterase (TIGR00282 family)
MFAILFIGDIVGRAGRQAVSALIDDLVHEFDIQLVVANGENAAGGTGITPHIADQLFDIGIDVLTSGNHIWQKKEIFEYLDRQTRLIRPLNFLPENPGTGSCLTQAKDGTTVAVVNLAGRVFMGSTYGCPFHTIEQELARLKNQTSCVIVDFHAEATSEKVAMGWYLDGKVSAVVGTHTHVQTADEQILPQGTAYISDAGMTGAKHSVIGVKTELAVQKFLTYMPVRFESSRERPWFNGVVMTIDPRSGVAAHIERIQREVGPQHQ